MPRKKETRGRKKTLTARQYKKNQAASHERWLKASMKAMTIRFNLEGDADVLAKLEGVENKTDYIRRLIREDIENERIWGKGKRTE